MTFLMQALHLFVGFFCQKFILTSLFILLPAVAFFEVGGALGMPHLFRSRLALVAAAGLLFELMLVGFIRDAPDLDALGMREHGVNSLFAYALRCEVGLALLALPFVRRFDRLGAAAAVACASLSAAAVIDLLLFGLQAFDTAGHFLGSHDWGAPYHVVAAASVGLMAIVLAARPSDPGVMVCAVLGLVAATQGMLAYHGVSALSIAVGAVFSVRLYQQFRGMRAGRSGESDLWGNGALE